MIVDPAIVTIVFCVLMGAILLTPMLLARRRAAQEQGVIPVFETFCSGGFGWSGGTNIPWFRLSIYKEFLVIALISPKVIPFAQIARLEACPGVLGSGIRIESKMGVKYWLAVNDPERVVRLLRHA